MKKTMKALGMLALFCCVMQGNASAEEMTAENILKKPCYRTKNHNMLILFK